MATAIPSIGRSLHDVSGAPWIATAYLLTSAVSTDLLHQRADRSGGADRHGCAPPPAQAVRVRARGHPRRPAGDHVHRRRDALRQLGRRPAALVLAGDPGPHRRRGRRVVRAGRTARGAEGGRLPAPRRGDRRAELLQVRRRSVRRGPVRHDLHPRPGPRRRCPRLPERLPLDRPVHGARLRPRARHAGEAAVRHLDHRRDDGSVYTYILELDGLGTLVELRLDPVQAGKQRLFDGITIAD
jgi:hypothetical protein